MKAGEKNVFPRRTVDSGETHERAAAEYVNEVYGEKMLGGTQVRYLSGVPFDKMGMATGLPELSYAAVSETMQHRLYGGLIAPAVALVGLVAAGLPRRERTRRRGARAARPDERAPRRQYLGSFTAILGAVCAIAVFLLVRVSFTAWALSPTSTTATPGASGWFRTSSSPGLRLRRLCHGFAGLHPQRGEFHPLMRPALTASVFGYTFGRRFGADRPRPILELLAHAIACATSTRTR